MFYAQITEISGIIRTIATNSQAQAVLPWFRVHIVILNDPGRLMSVHIMHSGLAAGWSGAITLWIQQILYIIQYGDKVVMEYHLFLDWVLFVLFRVGH